MKSVFLALTLALGMALAGAAMAQDAAAPKDSSAPLPVPAGSEAPAAPASPGAPAAAAVEAAGEVAEIKGEVTAKLGDQAPRALAKGSQVFPKDVVSSKAEAKCRIAFYDESSLDVGPDSEVRIEDFVNDSSKPGLSTQAMKFLKGIFRYVTGQIVRRNPESLHLSSPLATIGIRGTTTDHKVTLKQGVKDGKPVVEVESELHALRESKTKTEVLVTQEGKTQVLRKPNDSVFLRPNLPGKVRPLSQKEMDDFATVPFSPGPFDPRGGALMKGGAN